MAENSSNPRIEKGEWRPIIRHILLNTWDPIGIANEPNAQDEYDSYIERIHELLAGNASDSEITEYLYWVVHELMGLDSATRLDMASTVEALKRIPLYPDSD